MEPSIQNTTFRSLLLFVIIGAVLLVAVILGVRWAKSRSDHFAQAGNKPTAQQPAEQSKPDSQKQPSQQPTPPSNPSPKPSPQSSAATPAPAPVPNTSTPSRVPATGLEDGIVPIGTLAVLAFVSVKYIQSRRRLQHAALI